MAKRSPRELLGEYAQVLTMYGGPDSPQAQGWKSTCVGEDEVLGFVEIADFLYRELCGIQREPEPTGDEMIDYTNMVHHYGSPNHPRVRAFVAQREEDTVFMRRIDVLNRVFVPRPRVAHGT
jgi:hypothetical protein